VLEALQQQQQQQQRLLSQARVLEALLEALNLINIVLNALYIFSMSLTTTTTTTTKPFSPKQVGVGTFHRI
jgi:hypothetical protein